MAVMNEWMRGKCWDLAVALHEKTGLPLYGLYDAQGVCHHAFVLDEIAEIGIDARGVMALAHLKKGCAGQEVKPLERAQFEQVGGGLGRPLDRAEIQAAGRYAKKMQLVEKWQARSALLARLAAPARSTAPAGP